MDFQEPETNTERPEHRLKSRTYHIHPMNHGLYKQLKPHRHQGSLSRGLEQQEEELSRKKGKKLLPP